MDSNQRSTTNCKRQVNRGVLDSPHETISEIFCRLPTESILICRVVCKTWYAVTKDPCFINTHGNSQCQPTRLILKPLPIELDIGHAPSFQDLHAGNYLELVDMEKPKTRRIPLGNMFHGLQIMCSCNGFLCMARPLKLDPVVIYNPITRDRLILPPSKSAVLHFEVGLGLDASTNTYKVVRAYTDFHSRRFEIISLGESSWRELTAPQRIVDFVGWRVEFLCGALYWTRKERRTSTVFFQFNLTDEKFRPISFPTIFYLRHAFLSLLEIRGIVTLLQGNSRFFQLWRIGDSQGADELSFYFHSCFDTPVEWGGVLECAFICQINDESFLLQVGYWNNEKDYCQRHLMQYFPDKKQYLELKLGFLLNSFMTVSFKPSLLPVPV